MSFMSLLKSNTLLSTVFSKKILKQEDERKMSRNQQQQQYYEQDVEYTRRESVQVFLLKGSDRLCKVVELSMQCCVKLLSDSFETYKTF